MAFGVANAPSTASARPQVEAGRPLRIGEVLAGSPLWSEWSRRFVRPTGRIVDTGSRGASHSEGQGYGMLLAVAAGDRAAFDRIWNWTRANLAVRSDSLFAWRWDPGTRTVSDRNNATDGDMLVTWALAEAADLWNAPDYAAAAAGIANDIARLAVVEAVGIGPVVLPASFGFTRGDQPDGPVVNLSYWIFPAFARLAQLAPNQDWESVRRSGLAILDAIQAQQPGAISNWTGLADGKAAPARRFPAKVGYDAIRIPLYLAFAPRANAQRLAGFQTMFPVGAAGLSVVDLRSGAVDEISPSRGYRAVAALRACAVGGQPFPREFYWLGEDEPYYPATLHALALVAALMANSECLDPVETSHLQPLGWNRRYAEDVSRPQPVRSSAPVRVAAQPNLPVYAPAVAEDESADQTSHLLKFGAPISALLALVGFLAISRRSKNEAFIEETIPSVLRERSPAPRHLPENPFHAARGEKALEDRLDIAARASWEWQRTAAVAYFRLAGYDDLVAKEGAPSAQRVVASLVAALAARVRKSDAVSLLGPDEIAVCLSLIADPVDLASVGRRLTLALRETRPELGEAENLFGLALYAGASTGATCLAEARQAFAAMQPRRSSTPRRKARAKTPA